MTFSDKSTVFPYPFLYVHRWVRFDTLSTCSSSHALCHNLTACDSKLWFIILLVYAQPTGAIG